MTHRFSIPLLLIAAVVIAGCSSPDLAGWRAHQIQPRAERDRGSAAADVARVRALRKGLDLAASRRLALQLVLENPTDPVALTLASRAESDAVFLFPGADRDNRDLAALSALDYARRADTARATDAAARAQLGWAMGTSTHLQPMLSRAGHAAETLAAIERALAIEPENATALATLAILNLRLATLPWIANLMAWGAPDGSLAAAKSAATRSIRALPSVENRLILAKCLIAADEIPAAKEALRAALKSTDRHPRDRELRPQARRLLAEISGDG